MCFHHFHQNCCYRPTIFTHCGSWLVIAPPWSRQKSHSQLGILCKRWQRVTKGHRIGLLMIVFSTNATTSHMHTTKHCQSIFGTTGSMRRAETAHKYMRWGFTSSPDKKSIWNERNAPTPHVRPKWVQAFFSIKIQLRTHFQQRWVQKNGCNFTFHLKSAAHQCSHKMGVIQSGCTHPSSSKMGFPIIWQNGCAKPGAPRLSPGTLKHANRYLKAHCLCVAQLRIVIKTRVDSIASMQHCGQVLGNT